MGCSNLHHYIIWQTLNPLVSGTPRNDVGMTFSKTSHRHQQHASILVSNIHTNTRSQKVRRRPPRGWLMSTLSGINLAPYQHPAPCTITTRSDGAHCHVFSRMHHQPRIHTSTRERAKFFGWVFLIAVGERWCTFFTSFHFKMLFLHIPNDVQKALELVV